MASTLGGDNPATAATSEVIQAKFDLGIAIALFNWPALTLAVSNHWGGADSEEKREWFAGAISDMFSERPQTDLEDVETTLLQVMLDEFEVNVDDETAFDVAQQITRLRAATLKGDFTEVDSMHEAWLNNKGRSKVKIQKLDSDDDEDEDDTDWSGEGEGESNEDQDTEMGDAPAPPTGKKDKPIPEVDEDGFTKVASRKVKK